MSDITVGDIVWIIDADRHSIIPARVNEQIMSRTIEGKETYHHIEFPSGKTQKLESLSAAWYSDLSGVRKHLLDRATELIEQTVDSAKSVALKKFNATFDSDSNEAEVDLSQESKNISSSHETSESVKVSLDNGQVVNVKLPQEFLDESFSG